MGPRGAVQGFRGAALILLFSSIFLPPPYIRVGESMESALSAHAAFFRLLACILTICDKKYRILTQPLEVPRDNL